MLFACCVCVVCPSVALGSRHAVAAPRRRRGTALINLLVAMKSAPRPPAALANPQGNLEATPKPVNLGTFNIGAAAANAYANAKEGAKFRFKLVADIRRLMAACDVVCLQEVNARWARVIVSVLVIGLRPSAGRGLYVRLVPSPLLRPRTLPKTRFSHSPSPSPPLPPPRVSSQCPREPAGQSARATSLHGALAKVGVT